MNDKWHPASEKPKELGEYLIQTETEYMCLARWTDISPVWHWKKTEPYWNWFDVPQYSRVVAWREKPEPYKMEDEE